MNPSDAQSRITLKPINGVKSVFPETVTIYWSKYQKKVNQLLKSFITSYLYSQFHSTELVADLGSKDTFLQQVDSSDAQFWITLEPINGVGPLFPETVTIFFGRNIKRKSIRYLGISLQVTFIAIATIKLKACFQV